MVNTYVMGDIHGSYKALMQCLQRSNFDYENDTLIQLGDVADGWPQVYECVEELLKIKNLIAIKGNHDDWTLQWMNTGIHPGRTQGGDATIESYVRNCGGAENWENTTYVKIPETHLKFFRNQHNYYFEHETNRVFVHGGFTSHRGIGHEAYESNYYWDRTLWEVALTTHAMQRGLIHSQEMNENFPKRLKNHKEIFIGHTATIEHKTTEPMKRVNVWNLDTGAGFFGKLTIMNVNTKEYWQSDLVSTLYPNEKGR